MTKKRLTIEEWDNLRAEYINGDLTVQEIAIKYGVTYSAVKERAVGERWTQLRKEYGLRRAEKINDKIIEKVAEHQAERINKLYDVADKLIDYVDESVSELNYHPVTRKTKTVEKEYDEGRVNKVKKEITEEEEKREFVAGNVDRAGVKQLTSALRDLKDVLLIATNNDSTEPTKLEKMLEEVVENRNGTI